jgi:hypothetical protein
MQTKLISTLLLAFIFLPLIANAQNLFTQDGNIFFQSALSKAPIQLTSSGKDDQPTLSPDKRKVAFVRHTPAKTIESALGPVEATELWVIGVDGKGAKRLVTGYQAPKVENFLANFHSPQFSPDSKRIYFLSEAWVTSGAVHIVDIGTGAQHFVCPGNSLEVLQNGRYAGHLLVSQHRYFLAGGSYDWLWLLTPTGKEVGPVLDQDASDAETCLAQFREMNNSDLDLGNLNTPGLHR